MARLVVAGKDRLWRRRLRDSQDEETAWEIALRCGNYARRRVAKAIVEPVP
jgi:hypothetical protein